MTIENRKFVHLRSLSFFIEAKQIKNELDITINNANGNIPTTIFLKKTNTREPEKVISLARPINVGIKMPRDIKTYSNNSINLSLGR